MQEVIKTFASIFFLYCSKNFLNKRKKSFLTLLTFPGHRKVTLCLMDIFGKNERFPHKESYFIWEQEDLDISKTLRVWG